MKDWFTGTRIVAHLGWVKDTEHSWVSGEVLVLSNGVILDRLGRDTWSGGKTTWQFSTWSEVGRMTGEVTPETAVAAMRRHGYRDLYLPSPVSPYETKAGPFTDEPGESRNAVPFTSVDQLPNHDDLRPSAEKASFFSLARWRSRRG
jgi:hypothetical protein